MKYEEFIKKLRSVATSETSTDPSGWTLDNPLWGHCAVASLITQDIYGGELVRGSLKDHQKYSSLRSHYWNRIDGIDVDFTEEQYPDLSYKELFGEVRFRNFVLDNVDIIRRYSLLNSHFDDIKPIDNQNVQ